MPPLKPTEVGKLIVAIQQPILAVRRSLVMVSQEIGYRKQTAMWKTLNPVYSGVSLRPMMIAVPPI